MPPYDVSNDIKDHLLQFKHSNIFTKFEHEQSSTWKTEHLQLVKLFEFELGGEDPFFIPGQEQARQQRKEMMKAKQKENIYNNFLNTDKIEDFDDIKLVDPTAQATIQIKYKKFHELPIKTRLDVLFYLC